MIKRYNTVSELLLRPHGRQDCESTEATYSLSTVAVVTRSLIVPLVRGRSPADGAGAVAAAAPVIQKLRPVTKSTFIV